MNLGANFDFGRLFAPKRLTQSDATDNETSVSTTRGFTLIELMLVIAIMGTLAAIGILSYNLYIDKVKVTRAIIEIKNIQNMIAAFEADEGSLPPNLAEVGAGHYKDPWGNDYIYWNVDTVAPGKRRKKYGTVPLNYTYDLYSKGKDGDSKPPLTAKASRDDIVRADDGMFVGLGEDY